jgi:hypothetical protein
VPLLVISNTKSLRGSGAGRIDSAITTPVGTGAIALPSTRRTYEYACQPDTMQQLVGVGKYQLAKQFIGFSNISVVI